MLRSGGSSVLGDPEPSHLCARSLHLPEGGGEAWAVDGRAGFLLSAGWGPPPQPLPGIRWLHSRESLFRGPWGGGSTENSEWPPCQGLWTPGVLQSEGHCPTSPPGIDLPFCLRGSAPRPHSAAARPALWEGSCLGIVGTLLTGAGAACTQRPSPTGFLWGRWVAGMTTDVQAGLARWPGGAEGSIA